jgi:hypothetical protein
MTPFRSTPDGYVARWERVERHVLARVARDVAELVRAESGLGPDVEAGEGVAFTGVGRVPHDPAVQRLLPDAHRDDADVAADFRHLTQTDLAAAKVARLEAFADLIDPDHGASDEDDDLADDVDLGLVDDAGWSTSGEVRVAREDAQAFAGALTDVRIVLAERLGLDDDEAVERLHDEVIAGVAGDDVDDELDVDDDDDGLAADEREGVVDGEQRRYWGGVFVAAGFAQESLVDEMLADLRAQRG